jgi:hypothetical protein
MEDEPSADLVPAEDPILRQVLSLLGFSRREATAACNPKALYQNTKGSFLRSGMG